MVELLFAGHDSCRFSRRQCLAADRFLRPTKIWHVVRACAWFHTSHLLNRSRDAAKETAKIRDVDECQQQTGDPEDVHVREEREQAEDGNDLELDLMPLVRHALRQRVQAQEQNAKSEDTQDKQDRHRDHKGIGLARRGDEHRQMLGRGGVQLGDSSIWHKAKRQNERQRNCEKSVHG